MCAQGRQERPLTWPRKLPALAAVKTPNASKLSMSLGNSRDRSGCRPANTPNTISTAPRLKVIEAADTEDDTDQNRERTHIFRLVYTWLGT